MSKTQKFIVTILVISVLFTVLCFPVSAQNIDLLDYNLYYNIITSSFPSLLTEIGGAGGKIPYNATGLTSMWAIDIYEPGTTYTFEFRCTLDIDNLEFGTKKYLNLSHSPNTSVNSTTIDKVYHSVEFNSSTKELKFIVKLNTDITDLGGYPVYLYLFQQIKHPPKDVTTNGWGIYAKKDSGGEEYVQSIVNEVTQMRQNDETFYSSALQTLNEIKQNSDQLPDNIRQILNERDQSEKQEGQTQTEEGIANITDSLTNVIPVNSIIDSIKPLYNACTYEGTQSLWTLPGIKLPQIAGVMEETTVSNDIQFDMVQFADQYIPESLLSLIRSVNGTGIVVFSVYEVISLINQVITGNFKEKESVDL